MKEDKMLERLMALIDDAFKVHYTQDKTVDTLSSPTSTSGGKTRPCAQYESIEDYTAQTGKRFRMTKDQKELGMTREEAFKLTHGEY